MKTLLVSVVAVVCLCTVVKADAAEQQMIAKLQTDVRSLRSEHRDLSEYAQGLETLIVTQFLDTLATAPGVEQRLRALTALERLEFPFGTENYNNIRNALTDVVAKLSESPKVKAKAQEILKRYKSSGTTLDNGAPKF